MTEAPVQFGGSVLELDDPLFPYVPRLVVDWLLDHPDRDVRSIPGTAVFADISGFTALTERLAARGKVGGEEMGELLNVVFEDLLTAAYDYGANLLKWGGDAVLLHFDGDAHAARACAGAWAMQQTMRRIGRLTTSAGVVRLGMSIGVHTGELDAVLVGSRHRELVITGPAATLTARMEKVASRGQVVISPATAAQLPARCVGNRVGDGLLLTRGPEIALLPNRTPKRPGADLTRTMSAPVAEHLESGVVDSEHRWITVGFLQFAGADALREQHGPDALAEAVSYLMNAVQEAAHANEVTFLATDIAEDGGKVVLTSGVPRSSGDDATRMLATLRRVVHPGGRLQIRAGATCGAVYAGDYGPFYRRTYSIAGDVVNLAARLTAHAKPGQVLALPDVLERSRTLFESTAIEPFAAKGKSEPVRAMLVGDLRRASEPVAAERLPLIGRDSELATMLAAAERAAAGNGAVVEVIGEPGIGKSRLIEELVARIPARAMWADGDIYERSTPYRPMHRLLRRTLALPVDVDQAAVAGALRDLVAGSAPDLLPWLPLIGIAAGVDLPSTPEVDRLLPEARRARLESATSDLLGRLLTTPVLFIVNDAHFMDDATLGLVRRLAADAARRPWLLVLTRRVAGENVIADARHVARLPLNALPPEAAAELLQVATDTAPLAGHRMRQLVERAGGNPMFLTHLVAARAAGADLDDLPDSIEGVVAAQIDRLPPRRRRWLRAAAVLGMTVDPTLLAALLAGTDLEDETWLGLEDFIVMDVDARLRFVHHLVRLTAYEGLPYRRRTELHARAAFILERAMRGRADRYAPLLSLHCLHGEQYESAWRYSTIAGDQARSRYAPAEAADCYRRALEAASRLPALPPGDVADVSASLALACMDLGETDAADHALRQARAKARSDAMRSAELYLLTARHRQHVGKHADGLRWVSRGRSLLRDLPGPDAARLLSKLGQRGAHLRYDQGAYRAGIVWARRSVAEAQRCGDPVEVAQAGALLAMLTAAAGKPVDDATMRESLATFDRVGDLRGKARAANFYGMSAYFTGNWDTAISYYSDAEHASRDIGRDFDAAAAAVNRAEVLVQQGRVDEAEPLLTDAIRVLLPADATSYLAFAMTIHGRAALARGDVEQAVDRLSAARQLCVDMGEADEQLTADALLAECMLAAGEPGEAARLAAAALAGAVDESSAVPTLHRVRGEASIALGDVPAGHEALREALSAARKRGSRSDVEAALDALLRHHVAADAAEALAWQTESAQLILSLGIVTERNYPMPFESPPTPVRL